MRLAGTYHPIPYLLKMISQYLPNVIETNALWLDYDKKLYYSADKTPIQGDLKIKTQELRNNSVVSEWTNDSKLFTYVNRSRNQLSLSDEDELNVLRLYFPSPIDGMKDMISITFSPNSFLKSLNIQFKGISSQEKDILSGMLVSILNVEHKRVTEEKKTLRQIEKLNQIKEKRISQLTDDLNSTELLYSSAIENIVQEFVNELNEELSKEFILTKEVIFKLAKEKLSLETIKETVQNAIYLAFNLNLSSDTVEVTEDHIQLIDKEVKERSVTIKVSKNDKVLDLLNRYEQAAKQLVANGITVNGKNLAAQLSPPVTPPAITDAIKKNESKISYFLQQYPERWENIRSAIRPINNLDQNHGQSRAI